MEKDRIVLISSYCDTEEKLNILKNNIDLIKNNGLDVMLNSPIPLPSEIINMCDFYIQTKENPILSWPQKVVMSWVKHESNNKIVKISRSLDDYGWAGIYQVKKLSEYALTYDYERYYHIIYDLIIDDLVLSTFKSNKKCNFFPFHEHKVSLHLMVFDKENLINFSNQINLDGYLKHAVIAEGWLENLLNSNVLDHTIEPDYVDDLILFHGNTELFNYSKIKDFKFFIDKNPMDLTDISLYFYDIPNTINLDIMIDGINTNHNVSNMDVINLGFNSNNIKDVIIEYSGVKYNITEDITNIVFNLIEVGFN